MRIAFTLTGCPVPKGRPRVTRGGLRTFTPSRTLRYENAVGMAAKAAGARVTTEPMRLVCRFYLPDGRQSDIDNLAKSVLDGLNRVAWKDDSQVRELMASKAIDRANPRVEVEIWNIEGGTP